MRDGRIHQAGTPLAVYNNPVNKFVAGFIGAPAMNLVEGDIAGGVFTAPGIRIPGLPGAASGPVTLGFRAEDATPCAPEGAPIAAPVYTVELLGDATLVTIRSGEALVTVKAPKLFRVEIGAAFACTVPAAACHLFDRATGRRL